MLLLFFLVPVNPHISCLFLLANRLIQVGDLVSLLLLKQFELPLDGLLLNICSLQIPFQLYNLAILVLNLILSLNH